MRDGSIETLAALQAIKMYDSGDMDKSYTAGILDGEGCVGFRTKRFYPFVQIVMSDRPTIEWLKKRWGGSVFSLRKQAGQNLTLWQFVVANKKAYQLLKDVLPYLHTKREQAEMVLKAEELVGVSGGRLSEELLDRRQALWDELKALKKIDRFPA